MCDLQYLEYQRYILIHYKNDTAMHLPKMLIQLNKVKCLMQTINLCKLNPCHLLYENQKEASISYSNCASSVYNSNLRQKKLIDGSFSK